MRRRVRAVGRPLLAPASETRPTWMLVIPALEAGRVGDLLATASGNEREGRAGAQRAGRAGGMGGRPPSARRRRRQRWVGRRLRGRAGAVAHLVLGGSGRLLHRLEVAGSARSLCRPRHLYSESVQRCAPTDGTSARPKTQLQNMGLLRRSMRSSSCPARGAGTAVRAAAPRGRAVAWARLPSAGRSCLFWGLLRTHALDLR